MKRWIYSLLLAVMIPRSAWGMVIGPYSPDANTLFLLHLDEAAGGSVTTNAGLKGGDFIAVNFSSAANANAGLPTVTTMLGFPGYSSSSPALVSFGNCESNSAAGYLLGYDFNSDGLFEGDQGDGTSLDFLAMTNLNIGNGGQSAFTLEALIRPASTAGNQEIICTDSDASSRAFQFRISNGTLMFQFINPPLQALSGNIPTLAADSENGFVANTWYHVAFTYDGTNGTLYWTKLDPDLPAANALASGPLAIGAADGAVMGPLCLGNRGRPTGTETFLGAIDEVRISSVARTANEMLFSPGTLWVSPAAITPANPVYAGETVTLGASVSGTNPLGCYWQSDGGSGGSSWIDLADSATNTYAIDTTGVAPGSYQYRLVATNAYGSATSSVVTLNLLAASGPVLTADTLISPAAAEAGAPVVMSAAFAGNAPLTYQWFFAAQGRATAIPIPGATNPTYSIASAQMNSAGAYFLTASNNPPGLGAQISSSTPAALSVSAGALFCELLEHPEETVITAPQPKFGWVYNPGFRNDSQAGYRIIVASSQALANTSTGDVWDSGLVTNANSINVTCGGPALQPSASYFWRVQTLNSRGQLGAWSGIQQFNTAAQLSDPLTTTGVVYQPPSAGSANCYPLRWVSVPPTLVTTNRLGDWFVDFGHDAFGFATVRVNGNYSGTNVGFGLGELAGGNLVSTSPGATIRYRSGSFTLQSGNVVYTNRSSAAVGGISPPVTIYGIVSPFRYLELAGLPAGVTLTANDVAQQRLQTEFDDNAATFSSSSAALNQVWSLCQYSMKALSFDGIYVDGDRERTPYEADTYMHMLSSYAVNNDFTMPRCTFEYLTSHLTWPTEWPMHMVFVAWADYQQTGDPYLVTKYYGFLTNRCLLLANAGSNGLVQSYPETGNTAAGDIIDWYRIGSDGIGNTDGYVPEATNAVINAFYYRCLTIMAQAAQLTGHAADAANFASRAGQVYSNYNAIFWNAGSQCYLDGEGTSHSSADANFFPLAFGLVPTNYQSGVVSFLNSRVAANGGMPPGVYGAQYMLEAMFLAGDADVALGLMTTNGPRGWLNMINLGSTITDEAWSVANKANEDWNHAWGAAAGNIIPRYVLGVRPLTAGYGQVLIQPQLGQTLSYVQGTIPTIRGPVSISASNAPGQFQLLVNLPGNVTATIVLPALGTTNPAALVDGTVVSGVRSNNWLVISNIGSGQHAVWLATNSAVSQATLYNNWAAGWLGTNASNPAMAGPNADPDGDGVPNLLEFAVGGDPLAADATNAAVRGSPLATGGFGFQFRQRNPPGSVTLEFQSSADLFTWTNTTPASVAVLEDFGVNSLWQAVFPVPTTLQFFRIRYSLGD